MQVRLLPLGPNMTKDSGTGLPVFEVELPIKLVDALVLCGLARSKREARQFIKDGAVRINGKKVIVEVGND